MAMGGKDKITNDHVRLKMGITLFPLFVDGFEVLIHYALAENYSCQIANVIYKVLL